MPSKSKIQFTQEQAQEMYTMLHTLVYALKDIQKSGLTVHSIAQIGENLAHLLKSIERVVVQADKLLAVIDNPAPTEPPIVQEIEDKLLGKDDSTAEETGS